MGNRFPGIESKGSGSPAPSPPRSAWEGARAHFPFLHLPQETKPAYHVRLVSRFRPAMPGTCGAAGSQWLRRLHCLGLTFFSFSPPPPRPPSVPAARHLRADRLRAGGCRGKPGQCAGHLAAQPALPADPAHAPHGPQGRHVEAPGLRHLRPQQSKWRGEAARPRGPLAHRWCLAGLPLPRGVPRGRSRATTGDEGEEEEEEEERHKQGCNSSKSRHIRVQALSRSTLWPRRSTLLEPRVPHF